MNTLLEFLGIRSKTDGDKITPVPMLAICVGTIIGLLVADQITSGWIWQTCIVTVAILVTNFVWHAVRGRRS